MELGGGWNELGGGGWSWVEVGAWFSNTQKVKNTVPRTYVISDLNGEEIVGTFYKLKNYI